MNNDIIYVNNNNTQFALPNSEPYIHAIKQYFKYYHRLDFESIRRYLEDCKGRYSNSTIAVHKAALKKYISLNIKDLNQRAILNTAFSDIKVGKSNKTISESEIVSKEVVLNMIERSNEKDGLIIKTLFNTGLRVSELIGIKLKDIKPISNTEVRYMSVNVLGKGNKERAIKIGMELYTQIVEVFGGQEYLFETHNHRTYTRQYIHLIVRKAGMRVLGTKQVHPHTLRHSFATHVLVNEKKSLKAVSSYLGHSGTAITSDFYIHDELEAEDVIDLI